MTPAHLDAVCAIESVSHSTPWTRGNFVDSLDGGHAGLVMQQAGTVCGYAVLMPLPGEAELLNITVAPEFRGNGLGRRLLDQVCVEAQACGAERLFLEVRASNTPAHTLYLRNGFIEVGLRRAYYALPEGGREDAVLMAKTL